VTKDTHSSTVNWQQYTAYTHNTCEKSVCVSAKLDTVTSGVTKQLSTDRMSTRKTGAQSPQTGWHSGQCCQIPMPWIPYKGQNLTLNFRENPA